MKTGQPDCYTTGQVARICKVTPRTIINWTNQGKLEHFKVPNSADRRITRNALMSFLKKYNLEIPPELKDVGRIDLHEVVDGFFLAYDNSEPRQLWVWKGERDETAEPWSRVQ